MEVLKKYDPQMVAFGLDEAALNITELCRSSEKTPEEVSSRHPQIRTPSSSHPPSGSYWLVSDWESHERGYQATDIF